MGEEVNPLLTTTSLQVVIQSNEVTPEPPSVQTGQSQFPQLLLIRLVLQIPHQLSCPSLDTCQGLDVFLAVRAQNWTQYSRCGLTSAEYRGTITSLLLLATLFLSDYIHQCSDMTMYVIHPMYLQLTSCREWRSPG